MPSTETSYKYQESELTSQTNVCAFYQVGTKPTFLMETFLVVLGKDDVYFMADITKNTLCDSLQLSCLEEFEATRGSLLLFSLLYSENVAAFPVI